MCYESTVFLWEQEPQWQTRSTYPTSVLFLVGIISQKFIQILDCDFFALLSA
jgi:hypothetical protein